MSDNIIPFDPDPTASTKEDPTVDKMCDIAYTRATVMHGRLSAVIDQLTHVNQALHGVQADCEHGGLDAREVNQYLSDIALIESLVDSFEQSLYE